jgi:hypothetical protein
MEMGVVGGGVCVDSALAVSNRRLFRGVRVGMVREEECFAMEVLGAERVSLRLRMWARREKRGEVESAGADAEFFRKGVPGRAEWGMERLPVRFSGVRGESGMAFLLVGSGPLSRWLQVPGGFGVGFGHYWCGEFGVSRERDGYGA